MPGQDACRPARRRDELPVQLGEERVGVDVAAAAEREAPAVADEVALAFGSTQVVQERRMKSAGSSSASCSIDPLARGGVRRLGDVRAGSANHSFSWSLIALPRRVAEHHVEAAAPAQDVAVVDLVERRNTSGNARCQWKNWYCSASRSDLAASQRGRDVRVLLDRAEGRLGERRRAARGRRRLLAHHERRAPGVGEQSAAGTRSRLSATSSA